MWWVIRCLIRWRATTSSPRCCFCALCWHVLHSPSRSISFPPGKGLLPRSARGNYGDYGDEFGGSLPVLLCIADLPAGGTRILLLLEGIHQRYVYHRAELGNLYLCRICDELLPDQGFALYHSGSGILRQEKMNNGSRRISSCYPVREYCCFR